MNTTITLGDAGLIIIGIGLIILIFYCINLVRNLIPTIKILNKILEDTQEIVGVAAESVEEAHKILEDVTESVSTISSMMKGNQSVIQALTSLINALASLKGLLKRK